MVITTQREQSKRLLNKACVHSHCTQIRFGFSVRFVISQMLKFDPFVETLSVSISTSATN